MFFVEGTDADKSIKAIFDDPSATEIAHWLPLFDGPLHRAPEAYFWERGEDWRALPNLEVALLQASIIEESSGAGGS